MQETWVQSLGQEDSLEKEMVTQSSILAGKSHGQRSLAGYCTWGHKELDTTEPTHRCMVKACLALSETAKLSSKVVLPFFPIYFY